MRKLSRMGSGLVLAGALVMASSVAFAAPAKHKKPGKKETPGAPRAIPHGDVENKSAPAAPDASDTSPAPLPEATPTPSDEPGHKCR